MARVTHRVSSKKRRKRTLKAAKGFRGGRSKLYRTAKETVTRAMAYAYSGRKLKKRSFKALWIARINAACKENGMKYSEFMNGLKKSKIILDRKVLSDIAVSHKTVFKKLAEIAKSVKASK